MGLIRNGKSDEELREERRQDKLHQMNLNAGGSGASMDRSYIREMTNHSLQDPTVDMLANMLDEDFMLGNLSDAEHHEYRWLARVMALEIRSLHPPEDGSFTGQVRAVAFDDTDQCAEPLSPREKATLEQFIHAAISRASRGKGGWQQEMFNKTITASETRQIDDEDDGGFL